MRRMERLKKNLSTSAATLLLVSLMLISSLTILSSNVAYAQPEDDMTFTSGEKINFTSNTEMTFKGYTSMQFWSGVKMKFGTNITIQFTELEPDGRLVECDVLQIIWSWPPNYLIPQCSWWEVIDPATGDPLGEFHVDWHDPPTFHIDAVYPGAISVPVGGVITARKKIDIVEPCEIYVVHWPEHWYPEPCSWWEIMHPETGELTGYEFHVDWTNESCEFHIDEMIPGPYILEFPWYEIWARRKIPDIKTCDYFVVEEPPHWWPEPCTWWEIIDFYTGEPTGYNFHVDWTNESCEFHIDMMDPGPYLFDFPVPYVIAEQKITEIKPCDWFIVVDPVDYLPEPCSWWEILDDTGAPTGLEFHVDTTDGITLFHVDGTKPDVIITIHPTYTVTVRKKIDIIQPCDWFRVDDLSLTPELCSWWEILDDTGAPTGIEFHVDQTIPADGWFHIDEVLPSWPIDVLPTYMLTAEKKIDTIQPCDWFVVIDPPGFTPEPCSWWEIIWPDAWAGIKFHVDESGAGIFHIDFVDDPPDPPPPPPWNVTARPYEPQEPEEPWYTKPPFPDYAPSGMPDFDQRQWGTYLWQDLWGAWSHCGPVACANSLWWFDSEYEYYYNPSSPPPPTYSDSFPLVQSYGGPPWDDHDPLNLPYLVEHLAWLMDCDALRTGPFTGVWWSGTYVNDMQAVPGGPGWDLAADIFPATVSYPPMTDNIIDMNDLDLVIMHLGETGIFYEHTADAWEDWEFFSYIEEEVERCQDVVLLLGFYLEGTDIREGGHYVTVAGVNSTTMELLISNPIRDDFEAGNTPGRSPVPHAHQPPEPPYVTHNNASLVSQDAYHVSLLPSPSGYHFILDGYFDPPWEARIEYAVVTSPLEPLPEPDIAVTNLTVCYGQTVVPQSVDLTWINVTVTNEGPTNETFTLTVHWNTTNVIGSTSVTLLTGETKDIKFTWDTSTLQRYANYTLSAYATPVLGETDTADNTYVGDTVILVVQGDVDGDKDVDLYDAVKMLVRYGAKEGSSNYDPNCDIDNDGDIDLYDAVRLLLRYGYKEP